MITNLTSLIFKTVALLYFVMFSVVTTSAQWPALSTPNVPVTQSSATGGNLKDYWACSDGKGGSYSLFTDDRQDPGGNESVYCQRIDNNGNIKFAANGIAVAAIATADQDRPKVTSDGFNNAIACWQDDKSSPGNDDIYVQKIDTNGNLLWTAGGVLICSATDVQDKAWIISDGSGGAIVAWEDARTGGTENIYAQRVNTAGIVQWVANGVVISNAANKQSEIHMVEDGLGGAIITWTDERSGNKDIYAQRISTLGVVQWATNGVAICTSVNDQQTPKLTFDGNNGAIITWSDKRTGTEDIYAQRITAASVLKWTANGKLVSNAINTQKRPAIASDSFGGAIITWEDRRTGTEDIYAQRVDSSGIMKWTANGKAVCNIGNVQKAPDISQGNFGKVLIVWEDARTGGVENIYIQIIDTAGTMLGAANGIAVCTAFDTQKKAFIFKSGLTDWITIWQDDRNNSVTGNTDLYVQGLNPSIISILPIKLVSFEANLNDDKVDLKWITSTEINNDYFTIEKSKDLKNWDIVTTVSGAGNSNVNIEYFDLDNSPYQGISYYRLKQTDFDGAFTYSNTVPVKIEKRFDKGISLFPNPVERGHELKIQFSELINTDILIVIRDLKGEEFYSKVTLINEGGLFIAIPIEKIIPAGVYLVTASSESQIYNQKLIIK